MSDIFGYEKNGTAIGQVASSEFVSISVGGKISLAQNVTATYGQTITEVSNIGDSMIYWLPGKPKGSITVAKLVGAQGFLKDFAIGACGEMSGVSLTADGGRCTTGAGAISMDGVVAESVTITVSSGDLTVAESLQARVASMSA
jgi:hypothetical protein